MANRDEAAGGEPQAPRAPPAEKQDPRKIIYNAQVELIVDEFDKAQNQLLDLARQHNSYPAKSEVHGSPGSPRSGTWTLRVPVKQFDAFMEAIAKIGELRLSRTDSEDITDKYYDLQSLIKNEEAHEEGLRTLQTQKIASSKLEDLLRVNKELNAVRGQINVWKGQIQRWDKETELATIVAALRDRKDYVPPLVPDFGTSIGRTFQGSVEALLTVGKFIVLAVVALTPWLLILGVPAFTGWRFLQRFRLGHSPKANPAPGQDVTPP
jgi:hypothetical protein